jgi:hypothetical protein
MWLRGTDGHSGLSLNHVIVAVTIVLCLMVRLLMMVFQFQGCETPSGGLMLRSLDQRRVRDPTTARGTGPRVAAAAIRVLKPASSLDLRHAYRCARSEHGRRRKTTQPT